MFFVNLFYRIVIPLTIGAMLLWVIIDVVKKLGARRREAASA